MINDDEVLAMYLNEIAKIPLLSREEENELALRAKNGDRQAKNKIVNANLRFVVNVAKKYQNHGMELTDLISEGNIGLMTAIDKFDITKGYHFISYAVWWIRQSILKAISEKGRAIRMPLNRVNEIVQIEKARKSLSGRKTEEQEFIEVAKMLKMNVSHVREMININREMLSLDANIDSNDDSSDSLGNLIEDNRYGNPVEKALNTAMKDDLNRAIDTLKPNEAKVIRFRYGLNNGKSMSLKEVGEKLNLTKERIRQIEKTALVRLQHPVRANRLSVYVA